MILKGTSKVPFLDWRNNGSNQIISNAPFKRKNHDAVSEGKNRVFA